MSNIASKTVISSMGHISTVIISLMIVFTALCGNSSITRAQEGHWIEQRWQGPESKRWCWNLSDCKLYPETSVRIMPGGYLLTDTG